MFTESQKKALQDIVDFIHSPTQTIHCLSGSPGTGKSYLVNTALPVLLEKSPYEYVVTATTNKAAALLHAKTVYKAFGITLMNDYTTGQTKLNTSKLKKLYNTFLVIDEASMIDIDLWKIITSNTCRCKILLVGDSYQLPAVKASADVFNKYPVSQLIEVVRQRDPDFLKEISNAKEGVIHKEMYNPQECDSIKIVRLNDKEEIRNILTSFDSKDKILTYTNPASMVYAANVRKLQGKKADFEIGDPVFSRNYCVSSTGSTVFVEQELTIDTLEDTQVINRGSISLKVRAVSFQEVPGIFYYAVNPTEYARALKQSAREKDWNTYFFIKEKILDMRNHEACTIHCAQGSTYNRVFIDMEDIRKCKANGIRARLLYVAISRAKNEVFLYDSAR